MQFEWDPVKAASNLRKHGVSFEEATTVFGDPLALSFEDPDHSCDELRSLTFGTSAQGRALVLSHTEVGDTIRLISARRMTAREQVDYERSQRR